MIDIKSDSRKVQKGDTFIAIRNVARDGHDYIESAIENGATKIICEEGSYPVETVIVEDTRKYLEEYLYKNYYPKIKDLRLIGVTGTSGKTTTCYLTYQMLNKLGLKTAYIGTIGFYYGDVKKALNNTTPDVDLLYEMLLEAKENDCKCVVMEVSSHALDLNRIYGLEFDEVAFTNISQDHLDYHKTIENYIKAKKILFTKTRNEKIAIINKDDKHYKEFVNENNHNILIGKEDADVKIEDYTLSHLYTKFKFSYEGKSYETKIKMVCEFNIYNYLMALMLTSKAGFDIKDVIDITDKISPPEGRMEMIVDNTNSIFVDYAHKPDAEEKVLEMAKAIKKGRIITIIGCGGDRDKTKRPIMGEIAVRLSDHVIFTDDNPRTEDPKQIINDIVKDLKGDNFEIVYGRDKAIKKGVLSLKENDILLILGKGHENYQIIGTEKRHFSDKEEVLKALKEKNNGY